MDPGDVYLINDSYLGGTHTQDFNVFAPDLRSTAARSCFAGCIAHQIDIGGMAAGGYCPPARVDLSGRAYGFPGSSCSTAASCATTCCGSLLRNVRLP